MKSKYVRIESTKLLQLHRYACWRKKGRRPKQQFQGNYVKQNAL